MKPSAIDSVSTAAVRAANTTPARPNPADSRCISQGGSYAQFVSVSVRILVLLVATCLSGGADATPGTPLRSGRSSSNDMVIIVDPNESLADSNANGKLRGSAPAHRMQTELLVPPGRDHHKKRHEGIPVVLNAPDMPCVLGINKKGNVTFSPGCSSLERSQLYVLKLPEHNDMVNRYEAVAIYAKTGRKAYKFLQMKSDFNVKTANARSVPHFLGKLASTDNPCINGTIFLKVPAGPCTVSGSTATWHCRFRLVSKPFHYPLAFSVGKHNSPSVPDLRARNWRADSSTSKEELRKVCKEKEPRIHYRQITNAPQRATEFHIIEGMPTSWWTPENQLAYLNCPGQPLRRMCKSVCANSKRCGNHTTYLLRSKATAAHQCG
eukprot:scpid67680/ scgid27511/ 